jgi:hypothetical protein
LPRSPPPAVAQLRLVRCPRGREHPHRESSDCWRRRYFALHRGFFWAWSPRSFTGSASASPDWTRRHSLEYPRHLPHGSHERAGSHHTPMVPVLDAVSHQIQSGRAWSLPFVRPTTQSRVLSTAALWRHQHLTNRWSHPPHFVATSEGLPRHPAVAYLFLVRPRQLLDHDKGK